MGNEDSEQSNESTTEQTTEEVIPAEVQPGEEATTNASDGAGETTAAYEPFNLPDDWAISDEDNAAFSEIASDMGLDQDNAQKLVDLFISTNQARMDTEAANVEHVDGPTEWQAALHADEGLGGDNLAQTQANIDLAAAVMDADTLKHFKESGVHFQIPMARFLSKIGGMMQENAANLGGGGGGSGGDGKSNAQRMFANSGHQ